MSDRDFPPRGRQPASELEDLLAQVQQYWQGFRGGPIISLIVLAVLLIFLWSSWFTVQPEETAVVQRFGKIVRTAEPGLHFKWPYGIETVRLVPTARVLKEEFGFRTLTSAPGQRTQYTGTQASGSQAYKSESLMLTGDLNVIDVQWIIQYRIEDPIRYLFHVRDTSKTIRDITEAVMRRVVGNRLGSDVLTVGRVAVSTTAKEEIQQILSAYETGVRLVTVELQDVTPPDPVKPAFNEVNESRQDRERTINQAQEQVNREIPKAGGEAARSISEAQGYAIERVNRARGEASRFQAILTEYQQAPEVTRRRLHLEALGRFMTEMKGLYIVDSDQKAMVPWLALDSGPKDAGPKPTAEGRTP
jgi:modulator of FtsH protease HflK